MSVWVYGCILWVLKYVWKDFEHDDPTECLSFPLLSVGEPEDWDELLSRRTHRDTEASIYSGTISHTKFSLAFHSIFL